MATEYEYKYVFSDFLNDTCDAAKLQLQIQASAIVTEIEGINVKYGSEEVFIYFLGVLSDPDKAILDGVVAAHDGIPIVDNGSGWAESDSESGTTSATWQEKLHLDFNCIVPDSEYKVYWYAEVGSSDDKVVNEFRVKLDDGTILMEITQAFQKKVSEGHWMSLAGWKYFPLQVGNYTLSFEYRNNNSKTTYIRNARLNVEED